MLNNNLYLNFYDFKVEVTTNNDQILDLLQKDFGYFKGTATQKVELPIKIMKVEKLEGIIPEGLTANNQSINSITYNVDNVRYNDYYGEVISKVDYQNNKCEVYGTSIERLHEVAYLIILSRQGKWSDLNGLHKIHAMAVNKNNKNLIVMMPMKGGKSTLFTTFLRDENYNLISDDTPMVDRSGNIKPFPIRFGLEEHPRYKPILDRIPTEFKATLNRKQYGIKNLIDITFFKNRLGQVGDQTILIHGIRRNDDQCLLKKISKFQMFRYMTTHMIVGVGLPMVIEYFLETSFFDHFKNLSILLSRTLACIKIIWKSQTYVVEFGKNIDLNFQTLKKLLD